MLTIAHTSTSGHLVGSLGRAFPEAGLLLTGVEALDRTDARQFPHALVVDGNALASSDIAHLARIKSRHPWFAVLVLLPLREDLGNVLQLLGLVRVDEILILGAEDHPSNLRAGLTRAALRTVAATFEWAACPLGPILARPCLDQVILHIRELKHPTDLARVLGIPSNQLAAGLEKAGLPSAQTVLAWCRLMVGIRRAGDGEESIERVAMALNYGSRPAFENTSHRLIGIPPSEILRRGGLVYAGERLREAVALHRAESA